MAGILAQAQQQKTQAAGQEMPVEEEMPADEPSVPMESGDVPNTPTEEGEAPAEASGDELGLPPREEASPEEQEAFERGKAVGLKLISQKGAMDRIVATLRKDGLTGVAQMISMLVARVDEKMDLPETVIFPLATELSGFVFDAADRMKMKVTPEDAQKTMGMVFESLAQVYGLTAEDAKEAMDELEMGDGNPARSA